MKEGKEKEICRWIWGLITIPTIIYVMFFTDFVDECNKALTG